MKLSEAKIPALYQNERKPHIFSRSQQIAAAICPLGLYNIVPGNKAASKRMTTFDGSIESVRIEGESERERGSLRMERRVSLGSLFERVF